MLSKENRLHQEKEIKDLVKTGRSFFLPQLVIKYKKNKDNITKIGFIVSTKVDKRAVVRNKVARQLREVVRGFLPELRKGYSVLIIAKKQVVELDFATLKKQLDFAFNKTSLYLPKSDK